MACILLRLLRLHVGVRPQLEEGLDGGGAALVSSGVQRRHVAGVWRTNKTNCDAKVFKIKVFFPSIGGEPLKTGCGINNLVVTGAIAPTVSL